MALGFDQDILPIFSTNCLRCHATAIKLGGLDLSSSAGVLAGSATGAVVVPGNAEASKLDNLVRVGTMPRDKYEYTTDDGLEVRFHAPAGPRVIAIDFEKESGEPEGPLQSHLAGFDEFNKRVKEIQPAVDKVTLNGPINATGLGETPSRRKIFVCHPTGTGDELPCARKILAALERRAYRRPVTDADVQALLKPYKTGSADGGFEAGIKLALRGILVSPEFLFRIERDPPHQLPATAYRLSDLELASRLSFFLWSSIPDDQLLDRAGRGAKPRGGRHIRYAENTPMPALYMNLLDVVGVPVEDMRSTGRLEPLSIG